MSAGVAVNSSGTTSGKRLSSVARCFSKSTDAMTDRYASDSCQEQDNRGFYQLGTWSLMMGDVPAEAR